MKILIKTGDLLGVNKAGWSVYGIRLDGINPTQGKILKSRGWAEMDFGPDQFRIDVEADQTMVKVSRLALAADSIEIDLTQVVESLI